MLFLMSKNVCRMRLQVVFFSFCCCCNFCFCCCWCCCLLDHLSLWNGICIWPEEKHSCRRQQKQQGSKAARQQRGQLRQQHFTSMQAQIKVRHTLRRLAYAPPERVCVCLFVCIDVIPSSDIQIILSSGRSHKATTNSKCKKYFKSEQHMCNTLHATLLTINRAGREWERERAHTCVLPRICILIML